MTQRQINAAFTRSLKTVYKNLNPQERRLVKALEQIDTNDKSLMVIERMLKKSYGDNWRRDPTAKQEQNYILFFDLLAQNLKLGDRISRIEEKYNIDRGEVMKKHNAFNTAHCYGGSY